MRKRISDRLYVNAVCEVCGKEYFGLRKTAMYCSNACKQVAYRKTKEERAAAALEAKKQQYSLFDDFES